MAKKKPAKKKPAAKKPAAKKRSGAKTKRVVLFQPNLELSKCIGPDPQTLDDLVLDLGSDLEEMRWDFGSAAGDSKLIPKLEALVEEAGDPYAVDPVKLRVLVASNCAQAGTAAGKALKREVAKVFGEEVDAVDLFLQLVGDG